VGVALAESLHPDVRIKWPNDLWLHDRKLAGILIETAGTGAAAAPRFVVVGVGINITERPAQGLSTPPAWLQELWPDADAPQALARIALPLVQALQRVRGARLWRFSATAFMRAMRWRAASWCSATACRGKRWGWALTAHLLVHTASGMKQVTSSEVSVRPLGMGA
jgi:BirA family biotin operon repressor/biotin-[acetyl-CoA-carboxylase] ligase